MNVAFFCSWVSILLFHHIYLAQKMQHKKNARSHLPGKIAINQKNQFSNESIENNSSYFLMQGQINF